MKKISILFFAVTLWSCGSEDIERLYMYECCDNEKIEMTGIPACGVAHPISELVWLKTYVQGIKQNEAYVYCDNVTIRQGSYQGETVFVIMEVGAACCGCGSAVYNCDGEILFVCDFEKEQQIQNPLLIWKLN